MKNQKIVPSNKTISNRTRYAVLTATALMSVAVAPAMGATRNAAAVTLEIPAQPLSDALNAFAQQSGLQILFHAEAGQELTAPALTGEFTPVAALQRLLANTALEYEFVDERTVAIRPIDSKERVSGAASTDGEAASGLRLAHNDALKHLLLAQSDSSSSSSIYSSNEGVTGEKAAKDMRREPERLEEIIVSAQKRGDERLLDVPLPVTVVDAQELVETHQLQLRDYFDRVPGLTVVVTDAGGRQSLTLRGMSTGLYTTPTVAVTIDGVPFLSPGFFSGGGQVPDIDPGDLARVEVLRGPQGTLYGVASVGGLVNYVTADPTPESFKSYLSVGTTTVENGDGLGHSVRGGANLPLGENVAMKISGFLREDPGYLDSAILDVDGINDRRVRGARWSMRWRPADEWSLKLSALYQDAEQGGPGDATPALGEFEQDHPRGAFRSDQELMAYTADLSGQLGPVGIVSITAYNTQDALFVGDDSAFGSYFGTDLSGNPITGVLVDPIAYDIRRFTQEVRLTAPIGAKIDAMLGGYYTNEESTVHTEDHPVDRISGVRIDNGFEYASTREFSYRETALFGNLTLQVTDRFDIQVGGRQSWITQTDQSTATQSIFNNPPGPGNLTTNIGPQDRGETDSFTYLVTPRFKVTSDIMVYGRAATGYRAGGLNSQSICLVDDVPCTFDPDNAQTYEVGLKGSFLNDTVVVDASVYHIDWTDMQILLISDKGFGYTGNGGDSTSRGVELAVEMRPFKGTTLSGWIARNRTALRNDTSLGSKGDQLPYSSPWSGHLSVNQEFPFMDRFKGFVQASGSYVGERGGFVGSSSKLDQNYPAYVKVDVSAGLRTQDWSFNVFVNNLTDKRGTSQGNPKTGSVIYIQPRTMGINLTREF